MRLINTNSLRLQEVAESELQKTQNAYAIISHRWGVEELSFEDMDYSGDITTKKGYLKLKGFCEIARSEGVRYAWMDTCCINKASSTELGEAINSMYRWYSGAKTCIVYLEDVGPGRRLMKDSEWFERGWTLQELIAPASVRFYDNAWNIIGDKIELIGMLSKVTGVPENVLRGTVKPTSCSVAQRMSWAAKRRTERIEDRAYSLIGLFDVYLPMIYGERTNAFIRLQKEIIKETDDESIFTWELGPSVSHSGLLAPSPSSFVNCGNIVRMDGSTGFNLDNLGMVIELPHATHGLETYRANLRAKYEKTGEECAIILAKLKDNGQYARVKDPKGRSIVTASSNGLERRLFRVRQEPAEPSWYDFNGFWLRTLDIPGCLHYEPRVLSRNRSSIRDRVLFTDDSFGTAGVIFMRSRGTRHKSHWAQLRWLMLGFDSDSNPMCLLANGEAMEAAGMGWRVFEEAESRPDSEEHQNVFNNGWLETRPSPKIPKLPVHGGRALSFCILLRGDRNRGLDHKFQDSLKLRVSIQQISTASWSPKVNETSSPERKIWVVDITSLESGFLDKKPASKISTSCCAIM